MSSFVTVAQAIQEIENWLRLATLFHEPLKEALLAVLHNDYNQNYVGLPRNPVALNTELRKRQGTINQLMKKGVLKKDQVNILLPPKSNQTNSQTFDITLIIVLIISFTTLPPPRNGWKKHPLPTDISPAAFALLARDWRNRLLHADAKSIDLVDFNLRWAEGENIVRGLGLVNYNFNALKTRPLDVTNNVVVQSLAFFSKKILSDLTTVQTDQTQLKMDVSKNATELANQNCTLANHDNTLADHDSTIAGHDNSLINHENTLADHDNTLADHENTLVNHDNTLAEHKESILKFVQIVERLEEEHEFIKLTLPTQTGKFNVFLDISVHSRCFPSIKR